jgi:hypothetical protein
MDGKIPNDLCKQVQVIGNRLDEDTVNGAKERERKRLVHATRGPQEREILSLLREARKLVGYTERDFFCVVAS